MILALCAIALIILVVWLARSYRRGGFIAGSEPPPTTRVGHGRLSILYVRRGSRRHDPHRAPAERSEPPRHR
jgi:hypothetical protein